MCSLRREVCVLFSYFICLFFLVFGLVPAVVVERRKVGKRSTPFGKRSTHVPGMHQWKVNACHLYIFATLPPAVLCL